MLPEAISTPQGGPRPEDRFLIGNGPLSLGGLDQCTAATTLVGYSLALQRSVVVAVTCKRWGCRFCGQQKTRKLASIAAEAQPNAFITLTVDPKLYQSPRESFDQTRRLVGALAQRIRRNYGKIEYMRVLEVTKKGWPHYHLLARCPFIPQKELSTHWAELSGAPIVDIRKVKKNADVYFYVVKYLSKQAYIQWTTRRVTMSKGFDLAPKNQIKPTLDLEACQRENYHPNSYLWHNCRGQWMERISPLIYGFIGPGKIQGELSYVAGSQTPSPD